MLLLLARHGNTFEAGGKVVWVGARTDLPLTPQGREQAAALGEGLKPIKPRIARVISGPLRRTQEHAAIAAQVLGFYGAIHTDERLREIDYGLWEGKTSEDIQALSGSNELKAWNEGGVWPASPGWSPSEDAVTSNVAQIAKGLADALPDDKAVLLVTSNGILKFFLKLMSGAFETAARNGTLKVATGHCCALEFKSGVWRPVFWNRQPPQLL